MEDLVQDTCLKAHLHWGELAATRSRPPGCSSSPGMSSGTSGKRADLDAAIVGRKSETHGVALRDPVEGAELSAAIQEALARCRGAPGGGRREDLGRTELVANRHLPRRLGGYGGAALRARPARLEAKAREVRDHEPEKTEGCRSPRGRPVKTSLESIPPPLDARLAADPALRADLEGLARLRGLFARPRPGAARARRQRHRPGPIRKARRSSSAARRARFPWRLAIPAAAHRSGPHLLLVLDADGAELPGAAGRRGFGAAGKERFDAAGRGGRGAARRDRGPRRAPGAAPRQEGAR